MLDTSTHVAACPIQVGDRLIQRCLVCGCKLADTSDPNMGKYTWKEGELVRLNNGFLCSVCCEYTNLSGLSQLPDDFCIDLVEYH